MKKRPALGPVFFCALKVLKIDGPAAHGATAWQGSEGSEGSKGSEGKVSPSAMSMKSALRDLLFVSSAARRSAKTSFPRKGAPQATEEQRGLDDRSQKSDVRLCYVPCLPAQLRHSERSEESRYM